MGGKQPDYFQASGKGEPDVALRRMPTLDVQHHFRSSCLGSRSRHAANRVCQRTYMYQEGDGLDRSSNLIRPLQR